MTCISRMDCLRKTKYSSDSWTWQKGTNNQWVCTARRDWAARDAASLARQSNTSGSLPAGS